ncbi:MAG: biliverdin-producing heme oxygenase [Betaproteobacteria bacterium]
MSIENALTELRLTTRAEHDRIENILRLTEPMPMARYAAVMSGFDAFLRAWEPRVHAALPERLQAWFRARRRGGFASADVEWLRSVAGVTAPAMSASAIATIPLGDLAEVLGSLYVIESSTLGGRVIAPQLKTTLGLAQGRGASYFHGFGGETGVMWNNFRVLASLEIGESSRSTVRACQSAKRTFAALAELFAPLAGNPPAPAPAPAVVQEIAPALLVAGGQGDAAAADATHIDLPVDAPQSDAPTLVEPPLAATADEDDTLIDLG